MPRLGVLGLCTAIALAVACVRLLDPAPLASLELALLDLRHRIRGPEPPGDAVVIVGVDEASLERIGRWPWPRARLAELVERIAAAKPTAIGLDAVFDEPDPSVDLRALRAAVDAAPAEPAAALLAGQLDGDTRLATAFRAAGRVVLGEIFRFGGPPAEHPADVPELPVRVRAGATLDAIPEAARVDANVPVLARAAASAGHVNFLPDADGGFRRVPLALRIGDRVAPAFSLELLRLHLGLPPAVLTIAADGLPVLTLGGQALPVDDHGRLAIVFRGPPGTFPHVSAADVIAGTVPPERLAGRIVLVAPTAVGFDSRPTPFSGATPGVEIHATVIDGLLRGEALVRPGWLVPVEAALVVLLGVLVALLVRRGGVFGPLTALALAAAWLAATQWAFVHRGIVLGAVAPVVAVVLCTLAGTLLHYLREARERARIRRAFLQYVGPEVTELLAREPERLRLGGERREVTILFADLRGFSGIAEGMSPDALAELLNEHLGGMTDIVFAHRGLLDKYIGDAVMALWGAPVDAPDHAARACRAALAMRDALRVFRAAWLARGWPRVTMGVGLDTGETVVGNFGSPQRFSYTAMGDHVNVASRLEALNKLYGTELLVSEATRAAAGDGFVTREVDRVRVVGRREALVVHELLGVPERDDGGLARRREAAARVLDAYRARRFDDAVAACEAALHADPDDALAAAYLARCRRLREAPPPLDWDGVWDPGVK